MTNPIWPGSQVVDTAWVAQRDHWARLLQQAGDLTRDQAIDMINQRNRTLPRLMEDRDIHEMIERLEQQRKETHMPWKPQEVEAARNLLYHYGKPGGHQPGSFTKALIRTFETADHYNRSRLLGAFPEFKPAIQILITQGASKLSEALTEKEPTQ